MAFAFSPAILLLVALVVEPSSAYWNCHACMKSLTVNLQVTGSHWSGTDNENRHPHFMELEYFCHHQDIDLGSLPEIQHFADQHPGLIHNTTLPRLPAPKVNSTIKALAFQTVKMQIPMAGLILRLHSRTYTVPIPESVKSVCGPCVSPINLRLASLRAAHSDGIQVETVSVYGNYEDGCSGMVLLNHGFGRAHSFGWLDTSPFPHPHPSAVIPLHKTGC